MFGSCLQATIPGHYDLTKATNKVTIKRPTRYVISFYLWSQKCPECTNRASRTAVWPTRLPSTGNHRLFSRL